MARGPNVDCAFNRRAILVSTPGYHTWLLHLVITPGYYTWLSATPVISYSVIRMNTSARVYGLGGSVSGGTWRKPTDSYRCTASGSLVLLPRNREPAPIALPFSMA